MPAENVKADFVRWTFDLNAPTNSQIPDSEVVLDVPCEFPRIDERFNGKRVSDFRSAWRWNLTVASRLPFRDSSTTPYSWTYLFPTDPMEARTSFSVLTG
jgi:hypothetical protein